MMKVRKPQPLRRLRGLRSEAGWTQFDVARTIGISQTTYCAIERGKRAPAVEERKKIARLFERPETEIFPNVAA